MGRLLIVVALLLCGCLPKGALSRRDEVEAAVYALTMDVDVTTEGAPIAPFRWHLEGTLAWSYARSYRDGSMGHLVRFSEMRARIERGAARVDVPVAFEGALVELRSFPDGEVLLVNGLAPYVGVDGHIELLDALWPGLSPHLPGSAREAARHTTSWPSWVTGGPRVRNRLVATWDQTRETWSYDGALSAEGGNVTGAGTARGEVRLGEGALRLAEHRFAWERATVTRWPTGATITQRQTLSGRLAHVGAAPAPVVDLPVGDDDPVKDALPLRLTDGRSVRDAAVDVARTAPFLLVPADLGPSEREAIRSHIGAAW